MKKNKRKNNRRQKGSSGNRKIYGQGNRRSSGQVRDVNSKEIFRDPKLCCQFLVDNVDLPEIKNIRPEDIEDVSDRYQAYFGVEFDSDTVKKIRLRDQEGNEQELPLFLVSLIEHKSTVDYDVTMQLFRYMVCIWHEYSRGMEKKQKGFLYPPILPIVYYEGAAPWTASKNFSERIWLGEEFRKYVPDFTYEVVRIHDYTDEELLARGDEMSLLMMINKVQTAEDFEKLRLLSVEQLEQVLEQSDPHIRKLIQDVMYSLMMKMQVPVGEADEYMKMIGERRMGYLFENFEKLDIQEERRKTAKAERKAEKAQREAEREKKKAEEAERKQEEAEKKKEEAEKKQKETEQKAERRAKQKAEQSYISACKEFSCTKEEAIERFIVRYQVSPTEAEEKVGEYWDRVI